ncbi:MAG: hypothetical protein J1F35_08145 [Erysipelotrichales bacterium]|nr:hypothetical protein [Erysipelotrichales bacterium]
MNFYGFKTKNAQLSYDSVRFDIALKLFEVNDWTYGNKYGVTEPDLRDCVRGLLKSSEEYVEKYGLPREEDTYRFSSGRWTVVVDEFGSYEILLDFNNYVDYDDDDQNICEEE